MPSEVYPLYAHKIKRKGFDYVWRGESWIDIMPEAIAYVKSEDYKRKIRSFAASSNNSQKQNIWNEIAEKKQQGLKRLDVYKDYQNIYSLSGFNKVWYKI